MSDLVYDLYWDILLRLPAESLFRFRSICKAWRGMIDDPSFIKAHIQNQVHNPTLLVGDERGNCSFSVDSLNFIDDPQTEIIDATPIKPLYRRPLLSGPDLMASCNGLLLLCQVVAKTFRPIPNFAPNIYGWGFGYDYDSDDYKVVRIDKVESIKFRTLLYSLKSDSWRMIEDYPCDKGGEGVFWDGKLYWIVDDDQVMELDLKTERYCKFPSPYESEPFIKIHRELYAVCGYLIYTVNYWGWSELHGWMMDLDKRWIKLFKLSYPTFLPPKAVRVVAYLKNKRQLLLLPFMLFDLGNNSRKDLSIGLRGTTIIQICQGSLVRLKDNLGGGAGAGALDSATTSMNASRRVRLLVRDCTEELQREIGEDVLV